MHGPARAINPFTRSQLRSQRQTAWLGWKDSNSEMSARSYVFEIRNNSSWLAVAVLNPAFAAASARTLVWRDFMYNLVWQSVICRPGKLLSSNTSTFRLPKSLVWARPRMRSRLSSTHKLIFVKPLFRGAACASDRPLVFWLASLL
jgi:hypothetical protein